MDIIFQYLLNPNLPMADPLLKEKSTRGKNLRKVTLGSKIKVLKIYI